MKVPVYARREASQSEPLTIESRQQVALSRIGGSVGDGLRLERLLGVGGTATVYAARHRNGRPLAVKILHPDLAFHPVIRERFLAEGYAANKVEHPDAVAVLDEGADTSGNVFIVMELLVGRTLLERLNESRPLPVTAVVAATQRILAVLAQAHDRGIVHRDIKPSNIFETTDGAFKLLDFGAARDETREGMFATRPGTTMGTPAFMAPELAAGRLDLLDALTDLWALGATMFQLLTGEAVHPAESENELIVRAATQPARSLATLRPDLQPWLVHIVDRALAFERCDRFPNARAMSEAISAGAHRAQLPSVHPSLESPSVEAFATLPESPIVTREERRSVPGTFARRSVLVVLVGVAGVVGWWLKPSRSRGEQVVSTPTPSAPRPAPSRVPPDARLPPVEGESSAVKPTTMRASELPAVAGTSRKAAHVSLPRAKSATMASPSANPLFFPNP